MHISSSSSSTAEAVQYPPPIPTGKGSRSSAVNEELISDYLDHLLQVPNLKLPKSSAISRHSFPAKISYGSLVARNEDSVKKLLKSASEFGVFLISDHRILAAELRFMASEAEWLFEASDEIKNRKELLWLPSDNEIMGWSKELTEAYRFRAFSKKMERVANKLDEVAKEISKIFAEYLRKRIQNRIEERESSFSILKYDHDNLIDLDPFEPNKNNYKLRDHDLCLQLPLKQCEYYVRTWRGPLSFDAGPDTIIVNFRDQLEGWSNRELKSVMGEFIFQSSLQGSPASFVLELRCSPSSLNHINNKKITIRKQILIFLVIIFIYKFYSFIFA